MLTCTSVVKQYPFKRVRTANNNETNIREMRIVGGVRKKIRKRRESLNSQLRDSRRRSRDRWPTVQQLYFDVSTNIAKF